MMLITCPGCEWTAKVEKRPKPPCPNCGALVLKGRRHIKVWMTTTRRGFNPKYARFNTYRCLIWLGQELRYKPGWAAVKYKKLYGEWPLDEWMRVAVPTMPSSGLVGWVIADKAKRASLMRKLDGQKTSEEIGEGCSDPGQSNPQDDTGMA